MMDGMDQVTAFGAVAATISNLGPGLGDVAITFSDVSSARQDHVRGRDAVRPPRDLHVSRVADAGVLAPLRPVVRARRPRSRRRAPRCSGAGSPRTRRSLRLRSRRASARRSRSRLAARASSSSSPASVKRPAVGAAAERVRPAFDVAVELERMQRRVHRLRRHHRAARDLRPGDAGVAMQVEQRRELRERQLNPLFSQGFIECLAQRVVQRLQKEADVLGLLELQSVAERFRILGHRSRLPVIR